LASAAWFVFLGLWTAALLTPQPVEVADSVLGDEASYYVGKVLHVSAYAVLSAWSGWVGRSRRIHWLLLGLLSTHALATEFFQGFVPLRVPSWGDVGLDHVGIVLGISVTWPRVLRR
jgi:VanZ family protein